MRTYDIIMDHALADTRTPELYVPSRVRFADMTYEKLLRGMCCKSGKKVSACVDCKARCSCGKEILRRWHIE